MATIQTDDAKQDKRRFRNILANSGGTMESGEARDLANLYVMGRDRKLYRISELDRNPDKQGVKYSLNFATNHGHTDAATGDNVMGVEDIIGDAKVWLEADGLHARVYFASGDAKADHAYAISDNASYSIGCDWYEDGYYGADNEIDRPMGILREISMVETGNDPAAMTIDTKSSKVATGNASGDKKLSKKGKTMGKTIDQLTPDERAAMGEKLMGVLDEFTTNAPEDETEPTADKKEEADNAQKNDVADAIADGAEGEKTADSKTLHMPVVVIKDRQIKNEKTAATKDWLTSDAGHQAFAKCLKQAGKLGATFDNLWRAEVSKHTSLDGVTGLPTPTNIVSMFKDALEKSDGIISHFEFVSAKGLKINLMAAVAGEEDLARAHGFKKGDKKVDQKLANMTREVLCRMVYKRLPLDALELWENPELIDFRSRELVEAIVLEIERAAIIGDGRGEPEAGKADLRLFADGRGFISIKSDAEATDGFGKNVATTYTAEVGDNLYDTVVKARANIRKEGRQFLVAKSAAIAKALTAKVGDSYLVAPGAKIEDVLGVERVYTPTWMDGDDNDAYLIVDKAYKMIGQNAINSHPDFDTSTNENILLDETPRGGGLGEYKSAVAIKATEAAA